MGLGLSVLLWVAPRALADEPVEPSQARCEYPPDVGVGAAGGGAAVSETHWQTYWARVCVQTTSPPIGILSQSPSKPGCEHEDRRAFEVDADQDSVEVERKSSCTDELPEDSRAQSFDSCTTAVDTADGVVVTDTCNMQSRSGDQAGWHYQTTTGSSNGVTIGSDGISVVRAGSESNTESGIEGSYREEVAVGPDGIERTYTSDYTFSDPTWNYHCDETWRVSTTDPLATQLPTVPPELC